MAQKKEKKMKIVPLNERYLNEAEKLIEKIFQPTEEEKLTLRSSIYPEKYKDYLQKHGFIELKYFVLVENDKVIGLTGLYAYNEKSYWLGWFCVDEKYRNKGFGKKLLDFAIYKAQTKKFLYLYTENSKKFQKARKLYEKYGFELYKQEDKYFYYKLVFLKHKNKQINFFSKIKPCNNKTYKKD